MGKCKDFYESAHKNYDATQALAHRVIDTWEATEVRSLTKDECAAAFTGFGVGLINGSDFVVNGVAGGDEDELRGWLINKVTTRKALGMLDDVIVSYVKSIGGDEIEDFLKQIGADDEDPDIEILTPEEAFAKLFKLIGGLRDSDDE